MLTSQCTYLYHSHSLSSHGDIRRCLVQCMCDCDHNHGKELHIKKGVWFTMHDSSYFSALSSKVTAPQDAQGRLVLQVYLGSNTLDIHR